MNCLKRDEVATYAGRTERFSEHRPAPCGDSGMLEGRKMAMYQGWPGRRSTSAPFTRPLPFDSWPRFDYSCSLRDATEGLVTRRESQHSQQGQQRPQVLASHAGQPARTGRRIVCSGTGGSGPPSRSEYLELAVFGESAGRIHHRGCDPGRSGGRQTRGSSFADRH